MKNDFVREPARHIPVRWSANVVVAGGGIAGVAAALAAARTGVSVLLLEDTCTLGGLATAGNVTVYLPIDDGCGRQVLGGIAKELLDLSVADLRKPLPAAGFGDAPAVWRNPDSTREERAAGTRFETRFNPFSYAMALEALLLKEGVHILYGTRVCDVAVSCAKITHLMVENKSGRSAIACKMVVDATGDADICWMANEATVSLDSNVACGWFYTVRDGGSLQLHASTHAFAKDATKNGAEGPFFRGDRADDVTKQVLASRDIIRDNLAKMRAENPDEDVQPFGIPSIPCFRMTRRIRGIVELDESHMHRWFDDAVCLAPDWRRRGPVWSIPWRSLLPQTINNVVTCGRCASWSSSVWDTMRVIPVCAGTGEAAGIGAALASRGRKSLAMMNIGRLLATLRERGVILDRALVEESPEG